MALKIFTGAKPFLKAGIKPFGITEIEMLTFITPGYKIRLFGFLYNWELY
jgi:hypothetical protein